jgi:hypothetical protein
MGPVSGGGDDSICGCATSGGVSAVGDEDVLRLRFAWPPPPQLFAWPLQPPFSWPPPAPSFACRSGTSLLRWRGRQSDSTTTPSIPREEAREAGCAADPVMKGLVGFVRFHGPGTRARMVSW